MSATELIYACAELNDGGAWQEFVSRFHRPVCLSIIRTAYRWGAIPQQVVDDLAQETYLKLCADRCRLLHAFASERPEAIEGYVRAIAANVAHDHFKSLHSRKRGSGMVDQLIEGIDQKAGGGNFGAQDTMEREILLKEIDDCLKACSEGPDQERDCLIFWLYYRQGLSAKGIASLPTVGLTAKGVESAIFRLTRLVREKLVILQSQLPSTPRLDEKGLRSLESF
jgi:RNA polymerase sigma-70 factor, ECF subfamily